MRGDVHRVNITDARGREQRGTRYVIIVQNEDMHLSTYLAGRLTRFPGHLTCSGGAADP